MLFITTTLLLSQLYVSVGGIPAWTHLFHCEFGPITFTKPHHFWGACRKPGNREVMNTEWLRWAFGLKSVSTPQISIHWRHYLKSRSDLKIFSRELSFPNSQIYGRFIAIKSTSFPERRSVCASTLSLDGCWWSLYIICIVYYIKGMHNVQKGQTTQSPKEKRQKNNDLQNIRIKPN